jgi:hypothetical protein
VLPEFFLPPLAAEKEEPAACKEEPALITPVLHPAEQARLAGEEKLVGASSSASSVF